MAMASKGELPWPFGPTLTPTKHGSTPACQMATSTPKADPNAWITAPSAHVPMRPTEAKYWGHVSSPDAMHRTTSARVAPSHTSSPACARNHAAAWPRKNFTMAGGPSPAADRSLFSNGVPPSPTSRKRARPKAW